jgi:hypothetical protein
MVELACKLVDEPEQKKLVPEKVTVGVSNTFTTNEVVALVPKPLVAEQYMVYVPNEYGKLMVVIDADGLPIITPPGFTTDHEYDVGELVADVLKVIGPVGDEQTTEGPVIGFITGICANEAQLKVIRNNRV